MKKFALVVVALLALGAGCSKQPAPIIPKPKPPLTVLKVVSYTSERPSTDFCNGDQMDSAAYKQALTKRTIGTITPSGYIDQDIRNVLFFALVNSEFANNQNTRVASTTYDRATGIVTMRPAGGWAGSSIFMCAWKPFVEKQLEQFSKEVLQIKWEPES